MKSSLGITHRANLCTIAEIYRPSVIFLLLIVWVCQSVVHSLIYTVSSGRSWMRLCVTVVQSHSRSLKLVPIGEARMQITIIVHYCDVHYAYLLSFPRYNDLLIENLHFYRFYSLHFREIHGMKASINKLEIHGLRSGEHRMRIRSLVLTYYHCVLDRQTNGQTHVIMACCSV